MFVFEVFIMIISAALCFILAH